MDQFPFQMKTELMAVNMKHKFALISHVLPPSPSGQAMVLYRLLNIFPKERFCLISRENIEPIKYFGSAKLNAKHYILKTEFKLPIPFCLRLTIIMNAFWGVYRRAKQIKKIINDEKIGLLIVCTGDVYDMPSAYLASKWTGIPLITYIFDDYAYQWTGFYRLISKSLEPLILKHARGIIVPNEYMQKEYFQRYSIPSTVIHNPCQMPDLEDLDKINDVFDDREINIVYTGSVYHAHFNAFRNLITAINLINRSDVKLHIYTSQSELELKKNDIYGPMVVYHPHVHQSQVPKVIRHADILFLPLDFDSPIPEVIKTSAPGKMGEYLSVGKPVLVHAPHDSFVSWYFRENNCGVVVDENSPAALSEAIIKILSDPNIKTELGKRARAQAQIDFNVAVIQPKFADFLKNISETI
jgi:glycosyltransferase involved in cell wall biosynthesis